MKGCITKQFENDNLYKFYTFVSHLLLCKFLNVEDHEWYMPITRLILRQIHSKRTKKLWCQGQWHTWYFFPFFLWYWITTWIKLTKPLFHYLELWSFRWKQICPWKYRLLLFEFFEIVCWLELKYTKSKKERKVGMHV